MTRNSAIKINLLCFFRISFFVEYALQVRFTLVKKYFLRDRSLLEGIGDVKLTGHIARAPVAPSHM